MKYPSLAELTELTPDERLRLIEDVWETLASDSDSLPLSDDHRREIDLRLEALRRSSDRGSAWPDVRERIAGRK
jgi:putative addiction module component (TIGR02574 family)